MFADFFNQMFSVALLNYFLNKKLRDVIKKNINRKNVTSKNDLTKLFFKIKRINLDLFFFPAFLISVPKIKFQSFNSWIFFILNLQNKTQNNLFTFLFIRFLNRKPNCENSKKDGENWEWINKKWKMRNGQWKLIDKNLF